MSVKVYYTKFDHDTGPAILDKWLASIPEFLQEINEKYQKKEDRIRNLLGKLLLREAIKDLGYSPDMLQNLLFTRFGKPYLCDDFDFSISHSGCYVFCAISKNCLVGIDIEEIKIVDFDDRAVVMNKEEQAYIEQSENPLKSFFSLWTLKEAVLKAEGSGFCSNFEEMMVEKDKVRFNNHYWYPATLLFDKGYAGCLVSSGMDNKFEMVFKDFYSI